MYHIKTTFPKARKDYSCFGCLGPISKGTVHRVDVCVDCGDIFSTRLCNKCEVSVKELDSDDYFCEGDLRELHEE